MYIVLYTLKRKNQPNLFFFSQPLIKCDAAAYWHWFILIIVIPTLNAVGHFVFTWRHPPLPVKFNGFQIFREALRAAPSIVYMPNATTWWKSTSATVHQTFKSLLKSVSSSTPVLLIGKFVIFFQLFCQIFNRLHRKLEMVFPPWLTHLFVGLQTWNFWPWSGQKLSMSQTVALLRNVVPSCLRV